MLGGICNLKNRTSINDVHNTKMDIIVKFHFLVKEKLCFYCGGTTLGGGGVK
jgi:hypothetical protein